MTKAVLLDTNVLLELRAYNLAVQETNDRLLARLADSKPLYDIVLAHAENGPDFFVADTSLVELFVVNRRYNLYEFARQSYRVPVELLYERRANLLNKLVGEFMKVESQVGYLELQQTIFPEGVSPPRVIGFDGAVGIAQLQRQRTIMPNILSFISLETQDAYILSSAIAAGVDEIWTTDDPFRKRIKTLRDQHRSAFSNKVANSAPELFPDGAVVPLAPKPRDFSP
ncbi:MAG: hypothetical protein IT329_15960 [Caldilineaceae bacterium]|nr:hypothetical protein [Caldilineaceae bacterium]